MLEVSQTEGRTGLGAEGGRNYRKLVETAGRALSNHQVSLCTSTARDGSFRECNASYPLVRIPIPSASSPCNIHPRTTQCRLIPFCYVDRWCDAGAGPVCVSYLHMHREHVRHSADCRTSSPSSSFSMNHRSTVSNFEEPLAEAYS